MSVLWRIELFGGPRILGEDQVIDRFRTRKTALLLAYLAHRDDRFYSREQLIDRLWMDCDIEAGQNNLRVSLSSLRHQMEPPGIPAGRVLIADRFRIGLNFEAVETDVHEFQQKLQSAKTLHSPRDRAQVLKEAVALWQGQFLSGHYEDWSLAEEERLAGLHFSALQQLIRLLEETGDYEEAVSYAQRAVEADEFSEEAHRKLIHLYRLTGQTSLAIRQSTSMEKSVYDELGVKPAAVSRSALEEANRPAPLPFRQDPGAYVGDAPLPFAAPSFVDTLTFVLIDFPSASASTPDHVVRTAELQPLVKSVFQRAGAKTILEVESALLGGFDRAADALDCAKEIQSATAAFSLSYGNGPGFIRMALDTGEIDLGADGGTSRLDIPLALLDAANGGQILCSERTAPLLLSKLSSEYSLKDLGLYRLKGEERFERLYQLDLDSTVREEFPAPRTAMRFTPHLPPQFTRFVGREEEIGHLVALLQPHPLGPAAAPGESVRLVTLSGPGGSGKTRLSVETAAQLIETYQGAVWFVALAEIKDASLIPDAVLQGLRLQRSPARDPLDQIVERLCIGHSLLIFDNFEHLVEEGAAFVRALLETAPTLTCLVSSRHLLGLAGEREFPVRPLPIPKGGESLEEMATLAGIRLFLDRAQAVKPDFQLTYGNSASIAELCRRLEGIPLAIELAAARVSALSLSQMVQQLQRRLDFLVSRKRDQVERHRSLRAAIDWSYGLLNPELQRFFALLSVFRGGWGLQSATLVCREPNALDYLEQLLECSLIQRETVLPMPVCEYVRPRPETLLVERVIEEEVEEFRFSMLETIREYSLEVLASSGEADSIRHRRLEFYRAWTEFAMWRLGGRKPEFWMRWLNAELDNLRCALEWGLENAPRVMLRMAGNMGSFWSLRGSVSEGLQWLIQALEATENESGTPRLRALWQAGNLSITPGEYDRASAYLEEALEISRELEEEGFITAILGDLGDIDVHQGRYEAAQSRYEEALTLNYEILSRNGMAQSSTAHTHLRLGRIDVIQGEWSRAKDHFVKSMEYYRQDNGRIGRANAQIEYAAVLRMEGERDEAWRLLEDNLNVLKESGDQRGLALAHEVMGDFLRAESRGDEAFAHYRDALKILRELGHRKAIAEGLEHMALAEGDRGRWDRAARLLGAAAALREALRIPVPPNERDSLAQLNAESRSAIGGRFETASNEGLKWDWERAVTYALESTESPHKDRELNNFQ